MTKKTRRESPSKKALDAHKPLKKRLPWRWIINVTVLVMLAYIIYAQWNQFGDSLYLIKDFDLVWVLAGILAIFSTYLLAAFQYRALALKHIDLLPTWLVQQAGALANRILPAGLGGMGLSADYLHRKGHSIAGAGVVAGTNNLIGILMHIVLVGTVLLIGGSVLEFALPAIPSWVYAVGAGFGVVIIAIIAIFPKVRHWLRVAADDIKLSIKHYKKHPWRLGAAAVIALAVSMCFVSALHAAALALGVDLTFSQAVIVMTMGVLVGTATPTPGGVVGAEAGLATGLIAYGISSTNAIAIAILYRIISYWLPLIIGAIAFVIAQKKQYI